ncbi:MAG: hypothetical protein KAJ19_03870 [Gammaproteobacteria bacterium]|nr:hypothetical protein [Gammaproteobacteria bacterium]
MSMQGVYVGDRVELVGERAMLQQENEDTVLAQFNNLELGEELTHAWVSFPEADFDIDPPVNWEED